MSNAINLSFVTVSLNDAVSAILTYGETITPVLVSEPGVGKTSTLPMCAARNGDKWRKVGDHFPEDKYVYVYLDWSTKDLNDLFIGMPDRDSKMIEQYLTDILQPNDPRPHIVMIDEWTKPTNKMMQAAGSRLVLERMAGEWRAPKGSIFYATSNNASDGVGDAILAHNGNRVMILHVAKPTNKQWAIWAYNNDIDTRLAAWAVTTPNAFYSYKTCSDDELKSNAIIFIPNKQAVTFGSPRSYAKCDVIVRNSVVCGPDLTRAALYGTVGAAAAESMLAFFALEKDLVSYDELRANPHTAAVPEKYAAKLMVILNNIIPNLVTHDDLSACMDYVDRFQSNECVALFYCMLAGASHTKKLAANNKRVQQWSMENKNYELLN